MKDQSKQYAVKIVDKQKFLQFQSKRGSVRGSSEAPTASKNPRKRGETHPKHAREPRYPRLSLEDEANTMMSLCHPNIVKCHSWFQTHTSLYLALELVEGGDLLHRLLETGCFPECQAPTYRSDRSDRLYRLYVGYIWKVDTQYT